MTQRYEQRVILNTVRTEGERADSDRSYSMTALITFNNNDTAHYKEQLVVDVVMMICTFCKLPYPESTHLDTFPIQICSCVLIGIMVD